jgi:hypothetical protein
MKRTWILIYHFPHRFRQPETDEDFLKEALFHGQWRYHAISGRVGPTKPLFMGAGMFVIPDTWTTEEAEDFIPLTSMEAQQIEFTNDDYEALISAISFGSAAETVAAQGFLRVYGQ